MGRPPLRGARWRRVEFSRAATKSGVPSGGRGGVQWRSAARSGWGWPTFALSRRGLPHASRDVRSMGTRNDGIHRLFLSSPSASLRAGSGRKRRGWDRAPAPHTS